jgi:membrane protein
MVQGFARRLLFSSTIRRLVAWAKRAVIPGFSGFSLYEVGRFLATALAEGRLATRAAAIAFKLFLAFFPAVIVLLTLIPFVPIPDFQAHLLVNLQSTMPMEVYRFIENTLQDLVVKKHTTLLSVSFLVGLYLASNSIDAILAGFGSSTNLSTWHSALKRRILSLVLLLSLTTMNAVAILVLTLSNTAIGWLNEQGFVTGVLHLAGLFAVKWSVPLLLVMSSISLLFHFGDPTPHRFRFVSPGVLLATLLTLLVSQGLAFLFNNITDYNALYGSIGAILAVQLWLYANMMVLLIGFELNTSIQKAKHERTALRRHAATRPRH